MTHLTHQERLHVLHDNGAWGKLINSVGDNLYEKVSRISAPGVGIATETATAVC
jgi:hypothetical protein